MTFGIHPDIRSRVYLVNVFCAVLFLIGLIAILFALVNPELIFPEEKQEIPWWVLLITGILFCALSVAAISTTWWYRRASWVLHNVSSVEMQCTLHIDERWSDGTDYIIELWNSSRTEGWRVVVLHPKWDINPIVEKTIPVRVYMDPRTKKPVVIATNEGNLWIMSVPSSLSEPKRNKK